MTCMYIINLSKATEWDAFWHPILINKDVEKEMILYSDLLKNFIADVNKQILDDKIYKLMKSKMNKYASESEKKSWINSLEYLANILKKSNLPDNCSIAIEYNIPMTNQRIDFMITGYGENNNKNIILFELKQWSIINKVEESNVLLETFIGKSNKQVLHPAYQVWTYQELLKDYNENIQNMNINISSCVILHNYLRKEKDNLYDEKFKYLLDKVNVYSKNDEKKLISFINGKIQFGDDFEIINNIEKSNYRPSKNLQNNIDDLLKNNHSFHLVDDQMTIFDSVLRLSKNNHKEVIIISGNPGTGKSIIAVNLLCNEIKNGKMCQYVSRNTAPRAVYSYKLKDTLNKNSIDNLFKTSGNFTKEETNRFDMLIVDEAHCLTKKSGFFSNYGENQIKEIVNSAKCTVFFIDERQKVHLNDIGTVKEIEKWANYFGANITKFDLKSQFRCGGSNNYLEFIDFMLGISSNNQFNKIGYDVKVVDTISELKTIVNEKNKKLLSRILAGYCWNWNKKEVDNSDYHDIKIDDFEISWNLGIKQTFAIDNSINEAGCVHSVQGLEFDYVGVIIGPDMYYENGKIKTSFEKHASTDPAFKGIKKLYKENKIEAMKLADEIIKNTYRILLTRGTKGCAIYCVDGNLNNYIKDLLKKYN